ncbi:SPOSA6832_02430, partial [Sporobolomyces salmonicolor]
MSNLVQGAWNKLSGSETSLVVDNMTQARPERVRTVVAWIHLLRCTSAKSPSSRVRPEHARLSTSPVTDLLLRPALYVVGVVVSLCGTGFLLGFGKQLRMMWDPVRRYAALAMVLFIALTFIFAFVIAIECRIGYRIRYLHLRRLLLYVQLSSL